MTRGHDHEAMKPVGRRPWAPPRPWWFWLVLFAIVAAGAGVVRVAAWVLG